MNYYKISNTRLGKDGIDTFAHWTDGENTVVSDVDVRRVLGFDLTPQDVQERYDAEPLTQRQLVSIRRSDDWELNKTPTSPT